MDFLVNLLPLLQFNVLIKIGFLAISLFFVVFLLIASRQVFTMNTIVNAGGNSYLIRVAVLVLLLIAVSLFLTALVIL